MYPCRIVDAAKEEELVEGLSAETCWKQKEDFPMERLMAEDEYPEVRLPILCIDHLCCGIRLDRTLETSGEHQSLRGSRGSRVNACTAITRGRRLGVTPKD